MKIIFLDFDGVLNSDEYFESSTYWNDYHAIGASYTKLDPSRIDLLNKLVKKSEAKVVVSSAWRIGNDIEELNFILKNRGAKFEIVDRTPIRAYDPGSLSAPPRGTEIQEYINSICIKPEGIVILDDYADMVHLVPYLVQTDSRTGLTEKDVTRALKILDKNYELPKVSI